MVSKMEVDEEQFSDQSTDNDSFSNVSEESSTNSDVIQPKIKSRKRIRKPQEWKRSKRKCLRNAGKEYVNSNGTTVPPRVTGRNCKCSLRCFHTVSHGDQLRILEEFNGLASFNLQNGYLHGLIRSSEPKRRYTTKGKDSKRKKTYFYYVRIGGDLKRVCLTAFCSVHGISVKRVRNIRVKDCSPPIDQRGKHDNRPNKISSDSVTCVKTHILSFPRQTSHYSRASNPNKRYLSPELNIKKMHSLYLQKCDEVGWPTVTEPAYRKIFCEQFNFGFGSPRFDTCKTCDSFNCQINDTSDATVKQQLIQELEKHHTAAELGFKTLKQDTEIAKANSASKLVISFDLQQNLPTPHIHTSLVFYLRQLWVYNLGIHNCGSGDGYMCMWPENVACRGSDEVASCLWNYFQSLPTTRKHVVAYSDSCGGQNKNFYIVCFWIYLLIKGCCETIDHKFLTPGHTYLPSDRDFALIEKKKKETEVFVPMQWFNLVEGTRVQKPFRVARMKREDFKDFKVLSKSFVNRKQTVDKQKLSFQKIAWFRYSKSEPTKVLVRYTLDETEEWKVWNVDRKKGNKDVHVLSLKYTSDNFINCKKYDDLMKIKAFIPQAYHAFYDNLESKEVAEDTDAENEDTQ